MTIDQINTISKLQRSERRLYETITKCIVIKHIDQSNWLKQQLVTIQQHIGQLQQQ